MTFLERENRLSAAEIYMAYLIEDYCIENPFKKVGHGGYVFIDGNLHLKLNTIKDKHNTPILVGELYLHNDLLIKMEQEAKIYKSVPKRTQLEKKEDSLNYLDWLLNGYVGKDLIRSEFTDEYSIQKTIPMIRLVKEQVADFANKVGNSYIGNKVI